MHEQWPYAKAVSGVRATIFWIWITSTVGYRVLACLASPENFVTAGNGCLPYCAYCVVRCLTALFRRSARPTPFPARRNQHPSPRSTLLTALRIAPHRKQMPLVNTSAPRN
ncbi:hypothetical protein VTK56DRAFT_3687 [Thermocarpiscus australiensis]